MNSTSLQVKDPDLKGFAVHNKLKETLIGGSERSTMDSVLSRPRAAPETELQRRSLQKPKPKPDRCQNSKESRKAETEGEEQPFHLRLRRHPSLNPKETST